MVAFALLYLEEETCFWWVRVQ